MRGQITVSKTEKVEQLIVGKIGLVTLRYQTGVDSCIQEITVTR